MCNKKIRSPIEAIFIKNAATLNVTKNPPKNFRNFWFLFFHGENYCICLLYTSIVGPGESSEPSGGDGEVSEVAVILQTYNGSFWSDVMRGVDKAIDELAEKGVKCTFNGPDDSTNLQAQIEMIEAAVARDVDALAVAPADSAAVGGAMGICEEKNIPVVLFDCSADSEWPVCLVSSDNYKLGTLAGEALGKACLLYTSRCV